jgi:hypothetical protein
MSSRRTLYFGCCLEHTRHIALRTATKTMVTDTLWSLDAEPDTEDRTLLFNAVSIILQKEDFVREIAAQETACSSPLVTTAFSFL